MSPETDAGQTEMKWFLDKTKPVFQVPQDYFQHFPQQQLLLIRAESDTRAAERSFSRDNPYLLPENYFETFPDSMLSLVGEDTLPDILREGSRENPYILPDNYFSDFEQQLSFTVHSASEEIKQLSPVLAALRAKATYHVPPGYFEKPKAKIMAMPRTAEHSIKWMRWVAAAAIIFIFSLGGWNFFNNTTLHATDAASFQYALAQIPDAAIQEYLANNLDDYDVNSLAGNMASLPASNQKLFQNLSDKDIETYLEEDMW